VNSRSSQELQTAGELYINFLRHQRPPPIAFPDLFRPWRSKHYFSLPVPLIDITSDDLDGSEEIEFTTAYDVFVRAGFEPTICGVQLKHSSYAT